MCAEGRAAVEVESLGRSPRRARWTSIVPEPAKVLMNGSTTVMAKAVATAASTALPPTFRTRAPASAPSGCSAVTRPRGARGVCFVTTSRERIMGVDHRSYQRRLEDDPAVDDPRRLREEPAQFRCHLIGLGQLAQQIDEAPHGADEVALVTAE